jgi:endoribonuclease Dicer
MSTFYLLVLDGAHNAHHGHPYAHLMLDYYHSCPPTERPRFTGLMAASASITPDILFAENACDASIYGLSAETRSILKAQIAQPEEVVTFYEPSIVKRDTTLCAQLKAIDPDSKVLKQQFAAATAT